MIDKKGKFVYCFSALVKTMGFSPRLSVAIHVPFSLREKVPDRVDEGEM